MEIHVRGFQLMVETLNSVLGARLIESLTCLNLIGTRRGKVFANKVSGELLCNVVYCMKNVGGNGMLGSNCIAVLQGCHEVASQFLSWEHSQHIQGKFRSDHI